MKFNLKQQANKKVLFLFISLISLSLQAQVYDGITQGTTYRILLPTSTDLDTDKASVSPLVGYMQPVNRWLSLTGIAQYNTTTHNISPQLWLNTSIDGKVFILFRSIYDTKPKIFRETISATYKVYHGLHFDCTWDNLFSDDRFLHNDRLQFMCGYDYRRFVLNAGYSCRDKKGFVTNLRFRIDSYNWVQLKYDRGLNTLGITAGLNFNK